MKQLRYANHKKSFNNIKYQTNTELSNKYWNIMSANKTTNVSWEILGTHKSYNQSTKRSLLCLNEKLAIALHKDDNINDVILKSWDTTVLKTLPLVVQCKFFR